MTNPKYDHKFSKPKAVNVVKAKGELVRMPVDEIFQNFRCKNDDVMTNELWITTKQ